MKPMIAIGEHVVHYDSWVSKQALPLDGMDYY
jgi:hypothetical protein